MNLQFSVHDWIEPIRYIMQAVEKRQTLLVLAHILLRAEADGGLRVISSNMEIDLSVSLQAEVENAQDSITLPARKLFDILKSLPADARVKMISRDGRTTLTSGRSRFVLQGLDPADYPVSPKDEKQIWSGEVDTATMLNRMGRVKHAMANGDVRFYLNGMLLDLGEGKVVATDGHRMSVVDLEFEGGTGSVIIPRSAVQMVMSTMSGSESALLTIGHGYLSVACGDKFCRTRLIDGRFPEYQRLCQIHEHTAVVSVSELTSAVSRVRLVLDAASKATGIAIEIASSVLSLSCSGTDGEGAEDEVSCEASGTVKIGVSFRYVADALKSVKSQNVKNSFDVPDKSLVLQDEDAEDWLEVIMPMRI